MAREARVEGGVTVGFRGPVFEDAGVGGGEEVGEVDVGFGAEGEEGGGWCGVGEGWGERFWGGGGRGGGCAHSFLEVVGLELESLLGGGFRLVFDVWQRVIKIGVSRNRCDSVPTDFSGF